MVEMRLEVETGRMGRKAACWLQVWKYAGAALVMLTEVSDNPGQSVTNAAEYFAAEAVRIFGLDPRHVVFIEHYNTASYKSKRLDFEDTYDLVVFDWRQSEGRYIASRPRWRRVDLAYVRETIRGVERETTAVTRLGDMW